MSRIENKKRISFWPTVKKEKFSIDRKNFLEISFYAIVDAFRKKFEMSVNRNEDLFFDKFIFDVIILSIVLIVFIISFLFIPAIIAEGPSSKYENSLTQVMILLVFCAFLWSGFVYVNHEFRRLVQEKIIPPIRKNHLTDIGLYTLLPRIFGGTYYEWESGIGFRIFHRTLFSGLMICFIGVAMFGYSILELSIAIIFSLNFQALSILSVLLFNYFIIAFILYIFMYTIFTVSGIFLYLFIAVRFIPLEINPLINLGGTGRFGNLIVNCLYLVSLAIGIIPFFLLFSKFEKFKNQIPQESFSTIGNLTESIRSTAITSVRELPLSTISENFAAFEMFFLFIGIAIAIIISLHYRIKERKNAELVKLEIMLKKIDFSSVESRENSDKNLYLLTFYEKVLNLYEWPIKRIFIVELLISLIPLLVSSIFI